ncbi:triose-phosphate isomerase [Candidatus Uhrbacteria bacterium]|nr:triose-phosphate isomerase [Candidatus Uhrbacteria bacterium]
MKRIFIANWKMQLLPHEAVNLASELQKRLKEGVRNCEIVLAPAHTALAAAHEVVKGGPLLLCAQDCFWEERGAYTGEVAAAELRELGCAYVLVGHSERRQYLGETDEMVKRKFNKIINSGMRPVLCVGEKLEERRKGKAKEIIRRQLETVITGFGDKEKKFVIAYEPVWAIGTGVAANPEEIGEMHAFIRSIVKKFITFDEKWVRIIYGGSVNAKNIGDFLKVPDTSGALVGGASLKAEEFEAIVKSR